MSETPNERGTGTFLGVPYDWRRPTFARVKARWWNPDEPRLIVPRAFGWGYDINVARLLGVKSEPTLPEAGPLISHTGGSDLDNVPSSGPEPPGGEI